MDSQLQTMFEQEENEDFLNHFRSICLYIGPPINLYFLFIDYQISGDNFIYCLIARSLMLLSYIVLLKSLHLNSFNVRVATFAFTWLHSVCVSFITFTVGDLNHPYALVGPSA